MLSLLRNDIKEPSYQRGLRLVAWMLFLYAIAIIVDFMDDRGNELAEYGKYAAVFLAAFCAFRAMAERRALSTDNPDYVSILDSSIISRLWLGSSIVMALTAAYGVYPADSLGLGSGRALHQFMIAVCVFLMALGCGYLRAARRWKS